MKISLLTRSRSGRLSKTWRHIDVRIVLVSQDMFSLNCIKLLHYLHGVLIEIAP